MSTTTVNISAAQVKELREKTGAPMMDCKKALTEAKGDLEQAVVLLRKRGISVAGAKGRARDQRRRGYQLHPRRRQDRRAGGSELRERFRGPHRRFQGAGARYRHAHRGQRSEIRAQGRRDARSFRAREGHLPRAGRWPAASRQHSGGKDRGRQDGASSTRRFACWSSLSSRTRPSPSRS